MLEKIVEAMYEGSTGGETGKKIKPLMDANTR